MTRRDLMLGIDSGITIVNVSSSPVTTTGVYIQALYSPSGPMGTNYGSAFGVLASSVTLGTTSPSNTTKLGANFLYNMIMNYGYQVFATTNGTNVTPGAAVDGTPWLVFLGVIQGAPVTVTTNISSSNDLVYIAPTSPTSYSQQICVACNDATQTCTTTSSGCYHGNTTSSTQQDIPCNLSSTTGCAMGVYPPA
jgi:hypothetical protein